MAALSFQPIKKSHLHLNPLELQTLKEAHGQQKNPPGVLGEKYAHQKKKTNVFIWASDGRGILYALREEGRHGCAAAHVTSEWQGAISGEVDDLTPV